MVSKDPNGKSIVVMTYDQEKGDLLFGAVYVDLLPPKKIADLHHDDTVFIVGSVFSYEHHADSAVPTDVVRIYGVVIPQPRKPSPTKKQ